MENGGPGLLVDTPTGGIRPLSDLLPESWNF